MKHGTIVTPALLAANPSWTVFDCRFDLARPQAGREAYAEGHIPGALYIHLDDDLSGPIGPTTGRHPLPDPAEFAHRVAGWGITEDRQVVVYDDVSGAYAVRLWWMLRWLGHEAVAVLDGGWTRWVREARPQTRAVPDPEPAAPRAGSSRPEWIVTTAGVQDALAGGQLRLLDVRVAERFRGELEPIDPVAGHIPGAINLPYPELLDVAGNLLPTEVLRARLLEALGETPAEQVAWMCGSGVTACEGILAMTVAGLGEGRLYAGSWSEWITDPQRPVVRGSQP